MIVLRLLKKDPMLVLRLSKIGNDCFETLAILLNDCFEMVKTLPNACFENFLKILKPLKIPKKIKIPPPTKIFVFSSIIAQRRVGWAGYFSGMEFGVFTGECQSPESRCPSPAREKSDPFSVLDYLRYCHNYYPESCQPGNLQTLKLHPTIAPGEFSSV